MKNSFRIILTSVLLIGFLQNALAQKDSTAFDNKLGVDNSYTGLSYLESAVYGFHITYTMKHHAVALGAHIAYQDLFTTVSEWERNGASFVYQYFPIRSNRLFSPYLFYDLNYGYSKSNRLILAHTDDGLNTYGAIREVTNHAIAHHFGIGTRVNIYKGFLAHLNLGGGPGTYGESVKIRSLQSAYEDTKESSHPFSKLE
ncbi:MAG: hypothetical protein ACPG5W_04340, partial [Flavobacteriales bacterium]